MERTLNDTPGVITDIQRFSLYDGPGIRTTVFLKGCPLRCQWCHNPECLAPQPQVRYQPRRCTGCGACAAVCPQGVHTVDGGTHALRRERCTACGACAAACPTQALSIAGRSVTAGEVLAEALRDRAYYEKTGGLTVSGGEPLAQPAFAHALLALAKASGLHTCVETSGYAPWASVERIRPVTDLFLLDWKAGDPARHLAYTGVAQQPILANLERLAATGAAIILRFPLVPGLNDTAADLDAIAALLERFPTVDHGELMAYHKMGAAKYAGLGLDYPLPGLDDMAEARKAEILAALQARTKRPFIWG